MASRLSLTIMFFLFSTPPLLPLPSFPPPLSLSGTWIRPPAAPMGTAREEAPQSVAVLAVARAAKARAAAKNAVARRSPILLSAVARFPCRRGLLTSVTLLATRRWRTSAWPCTTSDLISA